MGTGCVRRSGNVPGLSRPRLLKTTRLARAYYTQSYKERAPIKGTSAAESPA